MKRVLAALFGTVTGLVVLLNFKTHPPSAANAAAIAPAATAPADTSSSAAGPEPATSSGGSSSGGVPAASSSTATSAPAGGSKKTYTGDSVDTRWGPVQVQIVVTGGKVTSAQAVVYPTENPRDQEINSYAVPTLNQEAVSAGNANIDMVSGATYTSDGYIQSLQSALDKAGL